MENTKDKIRMNYILCKNAHRKLLSEQLDEVEILKQAAYLQVHCSNYLNKDELYILKKRELARARHRQNSLKKSEKTYD